MGHVESKTRSLGQICSSPCSPSRAYSLAFVLFFYQNVPLGDILVRFKNGPCYGSKLHVHVGHCQISLTLAMLNKLRCHTD